MTCIICGMPLDNSELLCPRCKFESKKQTKENCDYCQTIYVCTPQSPKRKYNFCPICGAIIDKTKIRGRW